MADNLSVSVSASQLVTVSGRSASLKTVIEDVCFRSGVDLLYFDAADRSFGGSYTDLPLRTFLDRVLRGESFVAESVRAAGSGAERLTTLRVLGDAATGAARRAKGGAGRRRWQPPPALVETAFAGKEATTEEQDAALATLASRIAGDPAQLAGFLATESSQIALALQRHRSAADGLRALRGRYDDPRITTKIDEILEALAKLKEGAAAR
jgi:hypothetical protein